MGEKVCYICLSEDIFIDDDEPLICDMCDEYFCYDCSYTFSLHYQHQGSRCYQCADQRRRKPLNRRDYKIDYILRNEESTRKSE
jgi:hypothetical protein